MRGRLLAVGLVVVIALALALSAYGGLAALGLAPLSTAGGTLSLGRNGTALPAAFWGVDVRSTNAEPPNAAALLRATPYAVLRYPGGIVGERMDLSTDTIYNYGGGSYQAPFGTAAFVQLCEAVGCRAIVQLPLEIDSPATAAKEVRYVEQTLGFHPAYWELGNEPAGWQCYGTAWANWGSACRAGGPGPWPFANESLAYIKAVLAVDPSARFVGLGGTGQGSSENARWITPLEEVAGHFLAAISIHSYVDGKGPAVATLQAFFDGLSSQYSLPYALAQANEAIRAACSSCSTAVFVTELGSANGGGSFGQYIGSFDDAVFYAAEVAQGLDFGAQDLCEFAWDIGSGGLISSGGSAYAKYTLASTLLTRLAPEVVSASVGSAPNVFAAATETRGTTELLVANANAAGVTVSLAGSGLPADANATLLYWDGSASGPATSAIRTDGSLAMAGPSVALVTAAGSSNGTSPPPPLPSLPSLSFLGVPTADLLAGSLLGAGVIVAAAAPGRWRIAAVPIFVLAGSLFFLNWATTPVYGG